MAAGNTYVAIATQTLGSAAATIDFTSIPSTYTDLFIAVNCGPTSSGGQDLRIRFNSDTGTNYSVTILRGVTGGLVLSSRYSTQTFIYLDVSGGVSNALTSSYNVNVMNYANTTTYKTVLSRFGDVGSTNTNAATEAEVGLWRSTAAITSISLSYGSGNIMTGSTASLYGIAAA